MKFLVCTDGSINGLSAVHLGGKMAARMQVPVTLLCVVDSKRRNLDRSLAEAVQVLQDLGVDFAPVGGRGDLIEGILEQLLGTEYDLVIVGYQARGFLERALWGSLATRIAHELPVSVLIVRDRCETIRRMLVGVSGRGFTEACSDWAGSIAVAFGAHVTLAHVSQAPALMYAGFEEVHETLSEFLQTDTAEAHAMRQGVICLNEMGVETDVRLIHGLPDRELLRLMQDLDIDLLVVGSAWAAQPMRRALLRNITEKVLLRTRRPVLVVRPT